MSNLECICENWFYILHKCATCSKNKWISRASFLPPKVPDFNSY